MVENKEEYAVRFFMAVATEDMKYGWGASSQAVEKEEISQPTAYRAQEKLVEAGLLEKAERGSSYQLTEEGENLIDNLLNMAEKYSTKI